MILQLWCWLLFQDGLYFVIVVSFDVNGKRKHTNTNSIVFHGPYSKYWKIEEERVVAGLDWNISRRIKMPLIISVPNILPHAFQKRRELRKLREISCESPAHLKAWRNEPSLPIVNRSNMIPMRLRWQRKEISANRTDWSWFQKARLDAMNTMRNARH